MWPSGSRAIPDNSPRPANANTGAITNGSISTTPTSFRCRMLDETEFLSDYGVRALSKIHEREPYRFHTNGHTLEVAYWPAESLSGLFGGNSNWRGPIWIPVNYLLIESLQKFHHYYGDDFKVECPTGSGRDHSIGEVAGELATRLTRIFLRDENGERPV